MNVQLLLLLALVGPFCAFTHASPTQIPVGLITESEKDAATGATKEELTVVTGPPATEPTAASAEVTEEATVKAVTEADPEADPEAGTEAGIEATTEAITEAAAATGAATEAATGAASDVESLVVTEALPITKEPIHETEAPTAAAEAPEPLTTEAPAEETAAPTEAVEVELQPEATVEILKDEEVFIEEGTTEGMSSGQVAGIVLGSLLAVVIVIAVVIAAVRRMGKYSSPRNKKPQKKDSNVKSPLKRKTAKQQEHPKFWKF